ncbi:unnamed protein product [Symbiodinium sp. CCMP2456]|nr:unnamed protein product [Symbiodinium sp. CCMP2456]
MHPVSERTAGKVNAAQIAHWAEENGAVSVREVAEHANLFVEELGLDWSIADRMQGLR